MSPLSPQYGHFFGLAAILGFAATSFSSSVQQLSSSSSFSLHLAAQSEVSFFSPSLRGGLLVYFSWVMQHAVVRIIWCFWLLLLHISMLHRTCVWNTFIFSMMHHCWSYPLHRINHLFASSIMPKTTLYVSSPVHASDARSFIFLHKELYFNMFVPGTPNLISLAPGSGTGVERTYS
jgi:hypothetical protein